MATAQPRPELHEEATLDLFEYDRLDGTALTRQPFDFLVVPNFIKAEALAHLNRDYPTLPGPGNYQADRHPGGPSFQALLETLRSTAFADKVGAKFGLDLDSLDRTITIRTHCEQTDGRIHTDHPSKVVTMLLYFNRDWPHEGGRLRMVNSASDIEDYAAEVVPADGTLLVFRRADNSYHGHKPFDGERRMLQMSWEHGRRLNRGLRDITKPVRRILGLS
ncbi:MAG: 2OG-Fe(II) oxygenase [Pseudomonadota bacterium]